MREHRKEGERERERKRLIFAAVTSYQDMIGQQIPRVYEKCRYMEYLVRLSPEMVGPIGTERAGYRDVSCSRQVPHYRQVPHWLPNRLHLIQDIG